MSAKDPYKYFRVEGRELLDGLTKGVLELEKGVAGKEAVGHLLRLAHTLKGAARVVKQSAIADIAHEIEERLSPHRDGGALGRAKIDELLRLLDGIGSGLKSLDEEAPRAANAEAPVETVRIEIGEVDTLLRGVAEAGVQLTALRQQEAQLEHGRRLADALLQQLRGVPQVRSLAEELAETLERVQRGFGGGVDQVERELIQVRDTADRLRLLPASVVFAALERAVRDAARSLERRAELRTSGGENRVDAHVLGKVGEALLHLVRNAVAHGIEDERDRRAAGKPPVGAIEVSVEQRGSRLIFMCSDDGGGIDVDAVRAVAIRRGLVQAGAARQLDLDEAVQLLLKGGVSTTPVATLTSGRGVGLDVVRAVAAQLRGEVLVRSTRGRGTTVELRVPISLSSVGALLVKAADLIVAIPLAAAPRVVRVEAADVARSGARESILYEGTAIPFLPLGRALARSTPNARAARAWSVVVVQSEGSFTAVGVDRLLGAAEVVVRPLPSTVAASPLVAGASLDAEGNPRLLLDPAGIARAARTELATSAAPSVAERPVVLVVDDSLTTRMLEQSILESAGYEVDLATSGEEGLEKARARRYNLFLVDVEMPGIDGFEFVARTRTDPLLRETPSMLVTSRGAVEDKRRGEQVGARAYIVKSEFDQERLLKTIRGLIGA
jgi:two-component system chemotaxis sensor kinase CheA